MHTRLLLTLPPGFRCSIWPIGCRALPTLQHRSLTTGLRGTLH